MRPVPERIICTRKRTTIASDTIATPSERKRRQASDQRPGDTACGASKGMVGLLLELDPWIHRLVHEVGEQIEHHGRDGDVDGDRLDHGEVAAFDREYHLASDPGDGEEALDQEG